MAGFKEHDARDYSIVLSGVSLTSGYADGEFFTIEWDTDAYTDKIGTDGEVTRSRTYDERATVTLKYMNTSECNDRLSALHKLDKAAPNGAGAGPLMIRDREGRAVYTAERAWIAKQPSVSGDREATSREWKLRAAELISFHGGR